MAKFRRSTTGCGFCKARRKKCDETKPQCLRCESLGQPCNYEYIQYPEGEGHRVQRTRPAARNTSRPGISAKTSRNVSGNPPDADLASSSTPKISGDSTPVARSASLGTWSDEIQTSPYPVVPNYPDFQQDSPFGFLPQQEVQQSLDPPYSPHDRRGSDDYPTRAFLSAGQVDCLQSLFDLALPDDQLNQVSWTTQWLRSLPELEQNLDAVSQGAVGFLPTPPVFPVASDSNPTGIPLTATDLVLLPDGMICSNSVSILQDSVTSEDEDEDEGEDDPEAIRSRLCIVPTVDKNLEQNTLPFVLQCYSQWAIARFFEPLKIVNALRDQVITQFSCEKSRTRTIMIANVMDMFAKRLAIDGQRKSVLDHLALDVRKDGLALIAASSSVAPELDRQLALRTLDSVLEIFALQACTQSIAAVIQLLDYAAPVFRGACLEPPGQPLNLPNLLLDPNYTTRCRSRSSCASECIAFILLFAWINTLSETPQAGDNPQLVAWVEKQLPLIKVTIDDSGDPLLRIGRLVVQECWRFAVQIYLYLVLCKANAYDPRVVSAQKGFMRLIRGVRRARNPDAYLLNLIAIAGVATIEERDRDTLRQRILNVHEYAEQGTVGNEVVLMLEDVWARTRDEGRPAEVEGRKGGPHQRATIALESPPDRAAIAGADGAL
ncbi:hypothetical protein OPQ81_009161 [Rhizoctonia solani]|nr:hypothetical protein OPQ81_009161 [Rhizoctonia solani]